MLKLPRLFKKFSARFSKILPQTKDEFEKFAAEIFTLAEFKDSTLMRQTLASMIMHLSSTTDRKPKHYFVCALRKAMANDIAYAQIELAREASKTEELAKITAAKDLEEVKSKQLKEELPSTSSNEPTNSSTQIPN